MSLGRDLYKTRLCHLYQRGNCHRQSCSFAHGETELRRSSNAGVNNGRRDHRGGDLRDRLQRRHSPRSKRLSPGKETRGYHDRGRSVSRSPLRGRSSRSASPPNSGSQKRDKKKLRLDEHEANISNNSGRQKEHITEGSPKHDVQSFFADPKHLLEEELREVCVEMSSLTGKVQQLESLLEEKTKDARDLTIKNSELGSELQKQQENYKCVSSKLNKFLKLCVRRSRAEEEMRRSHEELLKLVEDTPSCDIMRYPSPGEDSDVNILSDGETKPVDSAREVNNDKSAAVPDNDTNNIKGNLTVEAPPKIRTRPLKSSKLNVEGNGKIRRWELNGNIPSTALAAHAEDEIVDTYDDGIPSTSIPYAEYAGDDEDVDVDGETVDDYPGNH